jgi:hypothetical protein
MRRNYTALVIAYLALSAVAFARERTWTGVVSDSFCRTKHSKASEEAAACVARCVSNGAEYVLVSGGKVYHLVPQAAFESFAGQSVRVVGREEKGRINVASFEPVREGARASAELKRND